MRRPAVLRAMLRSHLLTPVLVATCAAAGQSAPPAFVPAEDPGLLDDRSRKLEWPLDVLASDADADGDTDLLIHWHLFRPLELYENRGGRFVLRNPPGADASGLDDNRGVPDLFVDAEMQRTVVRAAKKKGLYVWHDADRRGSWHFVWKAPDRPPHPLQLELQSSFLSQPGEGLPKQESGQPDKGPIRVELADVDRHFSVSTFPIGVQLLLRFASNASGFRPAIFAGGALRPLAGDPPELWKPDPHGIAWVDVEGTPPPELFVTRGAVGGRLGPPMDPKEDRYYVHTGDEATPYRRARPGAVPRGYGRGRRVEWVDVDGDGRLDLSVSNESSSNAVLVRDDSGAFRDEAPELGLDFEAAAVQAWWDFDDDGRDDLFFVGEASIAVARRAGDGRFQVTPGASIGLAIPAAPPPEGPIDGAALHASDFDADGDLDLWLSGYGRQGEVVLFRREGEGFRDVTGEVGLAPASGVRGLVLLDADNDGFEDAVTLGSRVRLWWNRGGRRFQSIRLGPLVGEPIHAGAALDADADGRTDLALVGRRRHLLLNSSEGNDHLEVALESAGGDPVGTLVRARYDDGRIRLQRLGSAHSSGFSQSIQPLHFGIPAGAKLESVGVTWPGTGREQIVAVEDADGLLVVRRP